MNLFQLSLPVCLVAFMATTTLADTIAELHVTTNNGFSSNYDVNGIDVGNGGFFFGHQVAHEDFTLSANMVGVPTQANLGGSLQVSNATDDDLEFHVSIMIPVEGLHPGLYDWASSLTVALTGVDASVRTLAGHNHSIWTGEVGGQFLGSMLGDPFELSFSGMGSDSTDASIASSIDWDGGDSLTISYAFELSAGDMVTFGNSLGFIPAPGALALLGLAALTGNKRRRTLRPAQTAQPDHQEA